MKWGLRQRLNFIEFKLFWEGSINRKDLIDTFGVSVPQASADIKAYRKQAPGNVYYDKSKKQYLISSKFEPAFGSIDAHSYLSKLSMYSDGVLLKEDLKMGYIPEFSIVPSLDRIIDAVVLRKVVRALKDKKAIYIQYQSMSRPEPVMRWVSPHAFAFDGFRWHVRGYCELVKDFRDFVLGRILDIRSVKNATNESENDLKWNRMVTIKIAAHPDLTPGQRKIIEKEYNMKEGMAQVTVRAAFVYYFLLRFRLDNPKSSGSFQNTQAVVLNYDEIEAYI